MQKVQGRPRKDSKEVVKAVAIAITKEFSTLPNMGDCGEEVESDLTKAIGYCYSVDGYKVCRELESLGWDCDGTMVEAISNVAHRVQYQAIKKETQNWVKENKYTPAFEVGSLVSFRHRFKKESGRITKVYPDVLQYVVYCEHLGHVPEGKGNGTHGFIVDEENIIERLVEE